MKETVINLASCQEHQQQTENFKFKKNIWFKEHLMEK